MRDLKQVADEMRRRIENEEQTTDKEGDGPNRRRRKPKMFEPEVTAKKKDGGNRKGGRPAKGPKDDKANNFTMPQIDEG
jgi:hypothetical protein